MADWRLYYSDGSTFDSEDGPWEDAPSRGVQAIVIRSEATGREVDFGKHYYLWWPGEKEPWGVDRAGLWDFLHEMGSPLADRFLGNEHFQELVALGVKFGRSMSTPDFHALLQERVFTDEDFPLKTAGTLRESMTAQERDQ